MWTRLLPCSVVACFLGSLASWSLALAWATASGAPASPPRVAVAQAHLPPERRALPSRLLWASSEASGEREGDLGNHDTLSCGGPPERHLHADPPSPDGIRRVGPDTVVVPRALAEERWRAVADDPGAWGCHLLPWFQDGAVAGIKVAQETRLGLCSWLALKAGDTVLRVNGVALTPEGLLELAGQGLPARGWRLEGLRAGVPFTLHVVMDGAAP